MSEEPSSVRAPARPVPRWLEACNRASQLVYLALLAKSLLVAALNTAAWSRLHWLDCYLPGRVLLGSRIPRASKYSALISGSYCFSSRCAFRMLPASLKAFIFEFVSRLQLQIFRRRADDNHDHDHQSRQVCHEFARSSFANPFKPSEQLRRLNRSSSAWRTHTRAALLFDLMLALELLVVALVYGLSLAPMLVTRRGFEHIYGSCVQWLLAADAPTQRAHAHIYEVREQQRPRAPQQQLGVAELPFVLPLVDVVPLNWYHFWRLAADIGENLHFYIDGLLIYAINLYLVSTVSLDAGLYARQLHRRLVALNRKLRLERLGAGPVAHCGWRQPRAHFRPSLMTSQAEVGPRGSRPHFRSWAGAERRVGPSWRAQQVSWSRRPEVGRVACVGCVGCVCEQTARVQAALLDYFELVAFYNAFIGVTVSLIVSTWLVYTFIIFVCVLKPRRLELLAGHLDHGVKAEFVWFFVFSSAGLLWALAWCSMAERRSRRLYPQIALAAALESSRAATKMRWLSIMRYFYPRKLYAFTMFGNTALSLLSCLKLFSWVTTALFILTSA